jgi:two-component system, NarL family, nitrate/nitrite response regulator NarL
MENSVCVISSNAISGEGLARIVGSSGLRVSATVGSISDIPWNDVDDAAVALIDFAETAEQYGAVAEINRSSAVMKSVVLSDGFDFDAMTRCFATGAHGYILKNMPCSSLISSLHLVMQGQKVFPSNLADILQLDRLCPTSTARSELMLSEASLSRREMDVLRYLMGGDSNKVIARKLDVSDATVKVHVKAILRKLRVENRTQAAIWGAAHGLTRHPLQVPEERSNRAGLSLVAA